MNRTQIIVTSEYKAILEDVEKKEPVIFITGNAGTGKSTFLNFLMQKKNCIRVAPTGVAATNIKGVTIHSFFNISPVEANVYKTRPLVSKKAEILFKADAIVIDEISMVSALLLDQINIVCQRSLKSKEPFGGKQIIMFGDIGQLQPVVNNSLKKQLDKIYDTSMFFDSYVFKNCENIKYHRLTKNFRQADKIFSKILDNIRIGKVKQEDIDILNTRIINEETDDKDAVYLGSTNLIVNGMNDLMLDDIKEKPHSFRALVRGKFKVTNTVLVENLQLKKGCKVMMLANCPKGNYFNGTIGYFEGYYEKEHKLMVNINGQIHKIEPVKHEEIQYDLDSAGNIVNKVIGSFEQFPVKVGYAITIHKSQGMTFDKVIILNSIPFFGEGQGYVALSRCRTLEGIALEQKIKRSDFKTNNYSIKWLQDKV